MWFISALRLVVQVPIGTTSGYGDYKWLLGLIRASWEDLAPLPLALMAEASMKVGLWLLMRRIRTFQLLACDAGSGCSEEVLLLSPKYRDPI